MKNALIKISSIFVLICSVLIVFGQQNNTLYFMNDIPQANMLNPSTDCNCRFSVGGIIAPITGQVLPPIYFNYGNNAFSYKNMVHHGIGFQADSLITIFSDIDETNDFIDKLHKFNYLSFETNIDIFNLWIRREKYAFSFSMAEKVWGRFNYSNDLIRFAYQLNGSDLLGATGKLSFGSEVTYYSEIAIGYNRKINEKLNIGIRPKLLIGRANIVTKKNELRFHTDPEDYTYTVKSDIEIDASVPGINVEELYYDDSIHNFVNSLNNDFDIDILDFFTNMSNLGFGLDFGATYKLNTKFTFSASVIDLGFIRWKDNINSIKNTGEFVFDGIDVAGIMNNDTTTVANMIMDSIFLNNDVQHLTDPYTYYLPTKIYLGAQFFPNEKISFGGLVRTEYFQSRLHSSLTLSMNKFFTKNFQTTITYSILNNSFANAGLGFAYKAGPFQIFIINDNVLGMVFPQITRNINFRFGINWKFGCYVENSTMIE